MRSGDIKNTDFEADEDEKKPFEVTLSLRSPTLILWIAPAPPRVPEMLEFELLLLAGT